MIARHFPDMPARIAVLPRDARGFPVPKFVHWFDTGPDFRIMNSEHFVRCVRHRVCWICGEKLGAHMAFVIGPMCLINRISSEPPSHRDCARFACEQCPFLSKPLARRREKGLPEHHNAPGFIEHNPGAMALWVTRSYKIVPNGPSDILFAIGEPEALEFYAHGRHASRQDIEASIEKGFPVLLAADRQQGIEPAVTMRARDKAERLIDQWCPA